MAKKKEKPGVMLYWDTFDTLEKARGENLRILLRAIRNFAQYGEVPDFSDNEALDMAWPGIQSKLEYDDSEYNRKIEQKREAGRRGGLARASNAKQNQAEPSNAKQIKPNTNTITDTYTDTNTITEDNIADKPPRTRFVPPSVEEVREYCQERMNSVDPERFVDYYNSNGWMVGRNKMKDWKAAVRTWEKSNDNRKQEVGNGRTKEDQPKPKYRLPGQIVL